MRLIRTAHIAAATAALLLLGACTTASGPSGTNSNGIEGATGEAVTESTSYKLGLALPFTGPSASYGEEFRLALELGLQDANEQFAEDGISIELVAEDTHATAEGGVNAMNKIGAVAQAPAIASAWGSVVSAGASVAQDLDFALFNAGAQSPNLLGMPNVVNVLPLSDQQLDDFTTYLVEDLGHKTFATIFVDNETGQGTAEAFKSAIEERGGEMVAEESIRDDATDATAQVAKVKDSGADFLYMQTLLVDGAVTMRAIDQANLDMPMGTYSGMGESRMVRDAGKEAMNDMIYMSQIPEDIDAVRGLMDRMQETAPNMVLSNPSYNPYFYATPFIYAEAIKVLRAEGAPVTGSNLLAVLSEDADITVPIVGPMDLTNNLAYYSPTLIQRINDYKTSAFEDEVVTAVSAGA